jgi:glycosyltransferase involved in cell wall biosynthesis
MEGRSKAFGSIKPNAVSEFASSDLSWLVHRQMLTRAIDVVQLEYTPMAQYTGEFERIPCILFEHDVYFQSIGRSLGSSRSFLRSLKARFEYLRAIRYELRTLPRLDRIQVCSRENLEYLASFLPSIRDRLDPGLRAGIDTSRYDFRPCGREPDTILFLGSFRHIPNRDALEWFTRLAFPRILANHPEARLMVVGSDPPPRHSMPDLPNIEMIGFVEDVRDALARYAVFICPILSGSGVRVKLLEAFAAHRVFGVHDEACASGGGRELGHGQDHREARGVIPGRDSGEALQCYFSPLRSLRNCFTTRSAVFSNSLDPEFFGFS